MTTSKLTVVAQDKEASPGEVGVELDEDDVGGGVNRLQSRVPAELTNLRRGLVGTIPAINNNNKETKKAQALRHLEDNLELVTNFMSQLFRECTLFLYRTRAIQVKAENTREHTVDILATDKSLSAAQPSF